MFYSLSAAVHPRDLCPVGRVSGVRAGSQHPHLLRHPSQAESGGGQVGQQYTNDSDNDNDDIDNDDDDYDDSDNLDRQ